MYSKKKKNQPAQYQSMNPFKEQEKHYKFYQGQQTDFTNLITFKDPIQLENNKITHKVIQGYNCYYLSFPQGAIVVKQFLSLDKQIELAKNAINNYIKPPYRTNLYIYNPNKEWLANESQQQEVLNQHNKMLVRDKQKYNFNREIRWANLGLQYDWDNRKYPDIQSPIPQEVSQLFYDAESLLNLGIQDYKPQAVIVNYYTEKDTMGGHLDDGEENQQYPIYSFSLGLSCVFLIGGHTKDYKPLAMLLESGDLLVMAGDSRTCYHGVPRILERSFQYQSQNLQQSASNTDEDFLNEEIHAINYLSENRCNLNFRQVHKKDIQTEIN